MFLRKVALAVALALISVPALADLNLMDSTNPPDLWRPLESLSFNPDLQIPRALKFTPASGIIAGRCPTDGLGGKCWSPFTPLNEGPATGRALLRNGVTIQALDLDWDIDAQGSGAAQCIPNSGSVLPDGDPCPLAAAWDAPGLFHLVYDSSYHKTIHRAWSGLQEAAPYSKALNDGLSLESAFVEVALSGAIRRGIGGATPVGQGRFAVGMGIAGADGNNYSLEVNVYNARFGTGFPLSNPFRDDILNEVIEIRENPTTHAKLIQISVGPKWFGWSFTPSADTNGFQIVRIHPEWLLRQMAFTLSTRPANCPVAKDDYGKDIAGNFADPYVYGNAPRGRLCQPLALGGGGRAGVLYDERGRFRAKLLTFYAGQEIAGVNLRADLYIKRWRIQRVNRLPLGAFPMFNGPTINGFAFDPDDPYSPIGVHVYYLTAPDGPEKYIGSALANRPQPSLNDDYAPYGVAGNHGVTFDVSAFPDGSCFAIYGIDSRYTVPPVIYGARNARLGVTCKVAGY